MLIQRFQLCRFQLKQYDHSLNLICLFCYKDLKKCKEFRDLVIRNQQIVEKDWHKSEIGDPLEDFVKVENTDTLNSIVPEKLTVQPSAAKTQKQRKQCPICGIFVINLPEHEKIVHQSIRRFFCDYCQYSCFFKTKVQRHIQRHIPKSFRKNFPCEVQGCSFSASRKDALRSHALTKHQTSRRKNCLCIECGKRFYNNSQLNIHQKAVHEKLKNHLCTLCGKTFFNSKDMEIHQLRHGVKDQECTTCGNLFYCSLDLKRHIKTHADPVIPCQAKDCKKQFYTISKAKTHFKIKHEGAKDYFCDYCRYLSYESLKLSFNLKTLFS